MKLIGRYAYGELCVLNLINLDRSPRNYFYKNNDWIAAYIHCAADHAQAQSLALQFAASHGTLAGDPGGATILINRLHLPLWSAGSLELPDTISQETVTAVRGRYGGLLSPCMELVDGHDCLYWIEY